MKLAFWTLASAEGDALPRNRPLTQPYMLTIRAGEGQCGIRFGKKSIEQRKTPQVSLLAIRGRQVPVASREPLWRREPILGCARDRPNPEPAKQRRLDNTAAPVVSGRA